ncbi:unnamed protein product [Auanema sp. JU1783]|nr:unnamed protein product [Auanema sp. JU1783]
MKLLSVFLILVSSASGSFTVPSGAKLQLLKHFHDYITTFFTPQQVSKAIDITAFDIHRGRKSNEILSHLEDFGRSSLTDDQLTELSSAYDLLSEDLGNKGSAVVFQRIKKIVIYAVEPAIAKIRMNSDTPETAYETMLSVFTTEYVSAIKQLIHMTLTPTELKAVQARFGKVFHLI